MPVLENKHIKKQTGLTMHGANVALTPARALTSHARRHYEKYYRGRFRNAPWVFAFDAFLALIVFILIGLNIWIRVQPPAAPGLKLTLTSATVMSGSPVPLEAHISVTDHTVHHLTTLVWDLPPGTEILSATPALSVNREWTIGTIEPGTAATARIVVRLFVPLGDTQIGFHVRDDRGEFFGEKTQTISRSALTFDPMIRGALLPNAATPYLLKNNSSLALDTVELALDRDANIQGSSHILIGSMPPFSSKIFFVDPGTSASYRVQAISRGVSLVDREDMVTHASGSSPFTQLVLSPSTPGQETTVDIASSHAAQLVVLHPLLEDVQNGAKTFDVMAGKQRIVLPLVNLATDLTTWFVIPTFVQNGVTIIGQAVSAPISTPFILSSAARYYASSGDQIGIGPLPPMVGQQTKYWINWHLGSTSVDLSQLHFQATLPAGVRLTGRSALPNGGTITEQGQTIAWDLPLLAATSEGIDVAFEVVLTPSASMKGKIAPLLNVTNATAIENRSGLTLQAKADAVDTDLVGDVRAAGKGIVR